MLLLHLSFVNNTTSVDDYKKDYLKFVCKMFQISFLFLFQESSISPRVKEPLTVRVKNLTDAIITSCGKDADSQSPKSDQQASPDGAKKAKIGIAIKKSPNSDSTFESRLLDDDDPMIGGALGVGEEPVKNKGAMDTPTGPRSKKVHFIGTLSPLIFSPQKRYFWL